MFIASSLPAQSSSVSWQSILGMKMHITFASFLHLAFPQRQSFFCLHVRHFAKHLQWENRPGIQPTPALTTPPPPFVFWVIGSVCGCCARPWEPLVSQNYLSTASGSGYSDHECLSSAWPSVPELKDCHFKYCSSDFALLDHSIDTLKQSNTRSK